MSLYVPHRLYLHTAPLALKYNRDHLIFISRLKTLWLVSSLSLATYALCSATTPHRNTSDPFPQSTCRAKAHTIPIHQIQSATFKSPKAGTTVTVQGIVTGAFQRTRLKGFFIQSPGPQLKAYPNPVVNHLNISSDKVRSIEVYDMRGTSVLGQVIQGNVDLTNLEQGTYLIRLRDSTNAVVYSGRIIKN